MGICNTSLSENHPVFMICITKQIPLSPDGIQALLQQPQKNAYQEGKQDYDAIGDEILRDLEQKKQSEVERHYLEDTMNRIKELQGFIVKQKLTSQSSMTLWIISSLRKSSSLPETVITEINSMLVIKIGV